MPRKSRIFRPGKIYILPFLIFVSMLPPLSTSMYLPALPSMVAYWHTTNEMGTYTITVYMFIFALSMLIWGPLSDRYGRRPILVTGGIFYFIAATGIVFSANVHMALFWRGLQGAGAGAVSAISLAIVKDILHGGAMEKVISILQAGTVAAPLAAPIIGGAILYFISWHGIFVLLAICAAIMLVCIFFLGETAAKNRQATLLSNFGRIGHVLSQPSFFWPLLIFSMLVMAFMGFIGVSAYIFQEEFHTSAQTYSLFYSLIAGFGIIGPICHILWLRKLDRNKVITAHIIIKLLCCTLIIFFGSSGPWVFALLFMPMSFCGNALRPPTTVLMMEQIEGDNGVVASLIACFALFLGSISMILTSLSFWPNPVAAVGWVGSVTTALCLGLWVLFMAKKI